MAHLSIMYKSQQIHHVSFKKQNASVSGGATVMSEGTTLHHAAPVVAEAQTKPLRLPSEGLVLTGLD